MNVGRGARSRRTRAVISEINVTPFVDVLLIILIIFMVTAPMLNSGFDINLPKSSKVEVSQSKSEQLIIIVDNKSVLYVDKVKYSLNTIENVLAKYPLDNTQIYIQADKDVKYQVVISLMSKLNILGFQAISLITEPE